MINQSEEAIKLVTHITLRPLPKVKYFAVTHVKNSVKLIEEKQGKLIKKPTIFNLKEKVEEKVDRKPTKLTRRQKLTMISWD